jgi:hypothetical protein
MLCQALLNLDPAFTRQQTALSSRAVRPYYRFVDTALILKYVLNDEAGGHRLCLM